MKHQKMLRCDLLAAAAVAALLCGAVATPALAADGDTNENENAAIDEIIVTAQKREQSLNRVGMSITAAGSEQLFAQGIQNTSDLVKITPGLTSSASLSGSPLYTLRGVGFNDYTLGAAPAVSVYIDEVPLAYPSFNRGAVMDLQRVEVLKGPQGLLFGQNSSGGAINYIAAKPTQKFAAGVEGSFGSFNTLDINGHVGGALSSSVSARLSLGTTQGDDWQRSQTRDDTNGSQDLLRGRAQVLWESEGGASVLLSVSGWRDRSDTQAAQLSGLALQRTVGAGATADVVNARIAALRALPLAPDKARVADWTPGRSLKRDDHFFQGAARVELPLSSSVDLISLTSVAEYKENFNFDRDGTRLTNVDVINKGQVDSFSQEVRLVGNTDRFQWLVGGYYSRNDVHSELTTLTADLTSGIILPGMSLDVVPVDMTQDIRDLAAFGNVEFKVTDTLTLIGGLRYTESKNDFSYCFTGDDNFRNTFTFLSTARSGSVTPQILPGECMTFDANIKPLRSYQYRQLKEDNVSWRVGVNFQPTSDHLFYASVSKGYKSGSFPILSATTVEQTDPVTQESVLAFEAGAKLSLLDRKLQLNAAAFYYDYRDKQVRGRIVDPVFNLLERLLNVPKSRIMGGEIQIVARPVNGLSLNGGITYVDSEIVRFAGINNLGAQENFAGSSLPFSPKWQITGDAEYEWGVGDNLRAYAGSNFLHNSSTNAIIGNPAAGAIPAFTTVDLRLGIRGRDGSWQLGAFARNVFNEFYWNTQYTSQDVQARIVARPRTFGVNFRYNY